MNKTVTGTATWHRYDTYEYTFPFNRWELFKWFVKGKAKIKWLVRADKKRKALILRAKKRVCEAQRQD